MDERKIDVFKQMNLNEKLDKQSKERLISQTSHEGPTPPRFLSALEYEKKTLDMEILQPKVNNSEKEIKSHEYETTKVTIYLDKMSIGDKIEWH